MSKIKTNIHSWLKDVMRKENVIRYKMCATGNNGKDGGVSSEIEFIKVEAITKANESRIYNFVVKTGKQSESFKLVVPVRESFLNEALAYEKILPTFHEFQTKKGATYMFETYPKCYGTSFDAKAEVIILENLKVHGYEIHDAFKPMGLETIKLVLREFAKFHAISFAYKDQNPEKYMALIRPLHPTYRKFCVTSNIPRTVQDILRDGYNYGKDVNADVSDKIVHLIEKIPELILEYLAGDNGPNTVIRHGDGWNNNFMFKFKEDGITPEAISLLDWQAVYPGSPILDISYFLFSVCSKQALDRIEELLEFYHQVLCEAMLELGSDPFKLYPFTQMKQDWKEKGNYGAAMAAIIMKFVCSNENDLPDLVLDQGCDGLDFKTNDQTHFNSRLLDLITHPTYLDVINFK